MENKGLRIVVASVGVPPILDALLKSDHSVVGILDYSSPRRKKSLIRSAYKLLKSILKRHPNNLQKIGRYYDIPWIHATVQDEQDIVRFLDELCADLLVTCTCPLLSEAVFKKPRYGSINVHMSLLPKYRGAHPDFWTVFSGEKEGGVTVHFINSNIDKGSIIKQSSFPIEPGISESEYRYRALAKTAPDLLLEALSDIKSGHVNLLLQPDISPTVYAHRMGPQSIKNMLTDEIYSIEQIWRVLRFCKDWDGILPSISGWRKCYTWCIQQYNKNVPSKVPPGFIGKDRHGYYLGHAQGIIRLKYKVSAKYILREL